MKRVKDLAKPGRETSGRKKLKHRIDFDEVAKSVEEITGQRYDEFMVKRGSLGRPLLLWGARLHAGLTLKEIGEKAGGMDYAAVSIMIKRFERKSNKDKKIRSKMKALKTRMLNVEMRPQ